MKKTLLLLLLSISMIFALVACDSGECIHEDNDTDYVCDGCGIVLEHTHTDKSGDDMCDVCGKDMNEGKADELVLVRNGDALFGVLVSSTAQSSIKEYASDFIRELNQYYIEDGDVSESYDAPLPEDKPEIIIGPVSTRGEDFDVDTHHLGYKGFSIRVIGNKVFVIAGGSLGYKRGIDYLKENILMLEDFDGYIDELTISAKTNYEQPQTDYNIESIDINGHEISGYVIAFGGTTPGEKSAAATLQDEMYKEAGVWLETVKISNLKDGQRAIYIEYTGGNEERRTDNGFIVYVDEKNDLHVECEFSDILEDMARESIRYAILPNKSTVSFYTGTVFTRNVRDIFYEKFGAAGNGVTDDFEAILATHNYANTYGYTVNARAGAVYYIGRTNGVTIPVKTDVNWNRAGFIIDDTTFDKSDADRTAPIFRIVGEGAATYRAGDGTAIGGVIDAINEGGGIDAETCTRLDLGLGYPAMLIVYNDEHQNYNRYGSHYDGGDVQHEIISIDSDGNIDPSTRFMFDYAKVTRIVVRRVDDKPITIDGGGAVFSTVANQVPFEFNGTSPVYYYYARNISVERSNTVLKNLTHLVSGERTDCGAPYNGFIVVNNTNNVTVRDCVVTGHRNYNNMGSYDLGPGNSNNLTFLNVTQSNFFLEDGKTVSTSGGYWGVMGSSYCKNLVYDGCTLTRFDAHRGVYNATIRNSSVANLTLIGAGTFTMENSTVYAEGRNYLVSLRGDYGATWCGDFILKNVSVICSDSLSSFALISGTWSNHDFGYSCSAPTNVTVDGLTLSASGVTKITLATGSITTADISDEAIGDAVNKNPYKTTEKLIIRNNTKKYSFTVPNTFATEITYE